MTASFSLLKTQRFLPLFITQFLGAFNDNVFKNALIILITYRLAALSGHNAQILVTLAAGLFILPFFLFSALAGQLADKYEKSHLIVIIKAAEIGLMLIATLGLFLHSTALLMVVLFALGVQATFFGPLKYAILPEHLRSGELIAGNGLIEAGTFLAILLGTILGGLLILVPAGDAIISITLLIIACGGWISSLAIPKTTSHNASVKIRYHLVKETIQLITYARQRWDIFVSILGISWFWLIGATFLSEFPVFCKDILHTNATVVSLFFTLFSIGLAIGSLLCNKLLKGKVHATYVPLGALGITLFSIDLYLAARHAVILPGGTLLTLGQFLAHFNGWHISFDLVGIALCGGLYTVPLYAILQQRSDDTHRARIIAANNVLNALFMVGAAIATVVMLKLGFTVNEVFLSIAIANTAAALYLCRLLPNGLILSLFRGLFNALYRVKITGLEHYRAAGDRVVIVANHTSFLDAILLAAFLPDKLSFAVNTSIANQWWVKIFLCLADTFTLDATNPMALKSLIEFVRQNKRCVIFPEGRITMTGALMKIYEGPGLIADRAQAPLLPIHIEGAQFTLFSRLRGVVRRQWFPKITIRIFPPETLNIAAEYRGRTRRQKMSLQLYDVMRDMSFKCCDTQKTLFQSLLEVRATHGKHHSMIEDTAREPLAYHRFFKHCFILGHKIAKTSDDRETIGLLLPNATSTAIAFFALQAYGRVPAMLNYSSGSHNVASACSSAKIRQVYSSRRFVTLAKLDEMLTALNDIGVKIIYLEDLREQLSIHDKLIGLLYAKSPALAYRWLNTQAQRSADHTAVILFTSGSEGTPKGVVLSHHNIQANRFQLSTCIDFNSKDIVFNALPVFHSFGLTGGMLLPMLTGMKVFFYPSPLHYRIVPELVYDINATIVFGTDTFLAGYAKYAHPYDFYSVRYVFAGAEKLRHETRQTWQHKFGVRLFEGYGATEMAPAIAINTPLHNRVGTVGRLLPGLSYQLVAVPGIEKGALLRLQGPNVMQGYLNAAQPGVLITPEDNWYDTGDIVSIDDEGFVSIEGRVKRFAKIAGEMVSLPMVEHYLHQLWPTYQHAVIAVPDVKKGEQLVLITTNPDANREALVAYAKTHGITELAIPKSVVIRSSLLLLGSGKIDYNGLKAAYLMEIA